MPRLPRTRYNPRNQAVKDKANSVWAEWTLSYMKRNDERSYDAYIMDSVDAKSSQALLSAGFMGNMTAFTWDERDYRMIPARALGIARACVSASDLYEVARGDHLIVWHDGNSVGSTTLPALRPLFECGRSSVAVMVNIAARYNRSHETFSDDFVAMAKEHGYTVLRADHHPYRQGSNGTSMRSHWFECVKARRHNVITIDLTAE